MNILIFGATGFIGKNLIHFLSAENSIEVAKLSDDEEILLYKIEQAEVIINAAGVSRSEVENDFFRYNFFYSQRLFMLINKFEGKMYTYFSSIHYYVDTIYGVSKRYNEFLLNDMGFEKKNYFLCLRIPSIFGPGMIPNYVSVVATFCNNISNNAESKIIDGHKILQLLYLNDLIKNIYEKIKKRNRSGYELFDQFPDMREISVDDLFISIKMIAASENKSFNDDLFLQNLSTTYNYFAEKKYK